MRTLLRTAFIIVALLVVSALAFRLYYVPTGGMEPTIRQGDFLLVQHLGGSHPERGAIVVFQYAEDHRQSFVKRIVGLPGDRLHLKARQLYINGQPLREPYAQWASTLHDDYRGEFPLGAQTVPLSARAQNMLAKNVQDGVLVVPTGKYFVLGDNRDNSLDSRYWGFVDEADLRGQPLFVYRSTVDGKPQWGFRALAR